MILDHDTRSQVEDVIQAFPTAMEQNITLLGREKAFYLLPTAAFLAFAAVTQYAQRTPQRQHAMLVHGLTLFRTSVKGREIARRYGTGRRCMAGDREIDPFARAALELAKKNVDETNLFPNKVAAQEKLILKDLFEFCVIAACLEPLDLMPEPGKIGGMIPMANEVTAGILKSGWLTRNEIKIG